MKAEEWLDPPAGGKSEPPPPGQIRINAAELLRRRAERAAQPKAEPAEDGDPETAEPADPAEPDEHEEDDPEMVDLSDAGDGADEEAAEQTEAPEPRRGVAIPSSTEMRCPAEEFARYGQPDSYSRLKAEIEKSRRSFARRSRGLPDLLISGWWAAPGHPAKDALPIHVTKDLIETPYKDGTYYVRIRLAVAEESAGDRYFIAKMAPAEAGVEPTPASPADVYLKAQIALARTNEQYAAENERLLAQLREARTNEKELHDDLQETRADLAEANREIAGLNARVRDLEAAGEPLLDHESADALGVKVIDAANNWLSDPNKRTREYLEEQQEFLLKFFEAWREFFEELGRRPALLEHFLADASDLYDRHVVAFNALAKKGGATGELFLSAKVRQLLPPHEPEADDDGSDELLDALAQADALIAELKAENADLTERLEAALELLQAADGARRARAPVNEPMDELEEDEDQSEGEENEGEEEAGPEAEAEAERGPPLPPLRRRTRTPTPAPRARPRAAATKPASRSAGQPASKPAPARLRTKEPRTPSAKAPAKPPRKRR